MANSKIVYKGKTLIDISEDTIKKEHLFEGVTSHDSNGDPITGTFPVSEVDTQADLIEQIKIALVGKSADSGTTKEEQEKTVDITENGTTEILPDDGKALSKVTVNVNVSGGADTTDYLGMLFTQKLENVYSEVSGTLVPYTFYENDGVKTIELPNIEYLKERCFYHCSNLTSLKLPGLIGYTYQYMAAYCSKLTEVDIHNTNYVSSYTFRDCVKLPKVDLHRVGNIGTYAFSGCSVLDTLIIRAEAVPTLGGTNAFTNTPIAKGTGYIYVPSALIDSYKAETNWSAFANQFRAIEDYPEITGGVE